MAYGRIYLIQNTVNDKVYVGQTTQKVGKRFTDHTHNSRLQNYNSRLYSAMRKHGTDKFFVIEVSSADTLEQLNALEMLWIWALRALDKAHGYNLLLGGGAHGPHAEETILKFKEAARLRWEDPNEVARASAAAKKRDPAFGIKHSEDLKKMYSEHPEMGAEQSKRHTKYFSDPAMREAQSKRMTARFADPEYRRKRSALSKAQWDKVRAKKLLDSQG